MWGRHVFAVGGNAEASRRSGIRVTRIRYSVFILASMFAAAGGILLASRLLAVNQASGGSDLLLLAIAGPVIAGTSLFGGRGSVVGTLIGALIVGVIRNGLQLIGVASIYQTLITGILVILAVTVDQVSRRRLG